MSSLGPIFDYLVVFCAKFKSHRCHINTPNCTTLKTSLKIVELRGREQRAESSDDLSFLLITSVFTEISAECCTAAAAPDDSILVFTNILPISTSFSEVFKVV